MPNTTLRCETSNLVLLWPVSRPDEPIFYFKSKSVQWSHDEVELVLLPEATRESTFLHSLERGTNNIVVAFGVRVAVATIVAVRERVEKGIEWFHVILRLDRTDFSPSLEAGLAELNVDQLAEMRTRRLLLNEYPVLETKSINEVTRDLFIGGQGTLLRISNSIFPSLYQYFDEEPETFINAAWILAVTQLILSDCVTEIDKFVLELVRGGLNVSFRGRRRKRYANKPPYEIVVQGLCKLSQESVRSHSFVNMDQLGPKLHGLSAKISLVRATPQVASRVSDLVAELEALLAGLPPR